METRNYDHVDTFNHLSAKEEKRYELQHKLDGLAKRVREDLLTATPESLQAQQAEMFEIRDELERIEKEDPSDFNCALCGKPCDMDAEDARTGELALMQIIVREGREVAEMIWLGTQSPLRLGACDECTTRIKSGIDERVKRYEEITGVHGNLSVVPRVERGDAVAAVDGESASDDGDADEAGPEASDGAA